MISVIIPNWNGIRVLPRCLQSLKAQEHREFEIIVVDNGSTDESVDLIRREYPECRLMELDANLGFATACNRGAENATGDILFFLNSDTECDPGCLVALDAAFRKLPEAGAIACRIVYFGEPVRINAAGDSAFIDGTASQCGRGEPAEGHYLERREVFGACAAAAGYRRELFKKLGGFDDRFFFSMEDVDLAWRLQLIGSRCFYEPTAIVRHEEGGSLSAPSVSAMSLYYCNRNQILIVAKNLPAGLLAGNLHRIIWHQIRIVLSHVRRGPKALPGLVLRAKLAALLMLPTYLKERRTMQGMKTVSNERMASLLGVTQ